MQWICSGRPTRASKVHQETNVLIGNWSPKHPLPSTHENPTHLEGKHMCSTNHSVCTKGLGTETTLISREQQEHTNSKVPDVSLGPNLQAGFAKDSSLQPAMLTHFCTDTLSCLLQYSHHCSVVNTIIEKYQGKCVSHI